VVLIVTAGNDKKPTRRHLIRQPEPMLAAAERRGEGSVRCSALQNIAPTLGEGMVP